MASRRARSCTTRRRTRSTVSTPIRNDRLPEIHHRAVPGTAGSQAACRSSSRRWSRFTRPHQVPRLDGPTYAAELGRDRGALAHRSCTLVS